MKTINKIGISLITLLFISAGYADNTQYAVGKGYDAPETAAVEAQPAAVAGTTSISGTVRWFNANNKQALIARDDRRQDLYLQLTNEQLTALASSQRLKSGQPVLTAGQKLKFELEEAQPRLKSSATGGSTTSTPTAMRAKAVEIAE